MKSKEEILEKHSDYYIIPAADSFKENETVTPEQAINAMTEWGNQFAEQCVKAALDKAVCAAQAVILNDVNWETAIDDIERVINALSPSEIVKEVAG